MEKAGPTKAGLGGKITRAQVAAWCEKGILGLVLGGALFGPLALGAVRPGDFLVIQFATVAVLVLWLVRLWFGDTPRLLWTPLCWAVAAFAGYAVARHAQAEIEYAARQELIRVLVYAGLFFAALTHLHRQQWTRIIAFALVGLGTLLSLYALYQWLNGSERVWHYLKPRCYFMRASGTYICPDHLAGLLVVLMPIAFAYALTGRFKPVPRMLLGYAGLMMAIGLGVTLSVGAWTAAGVSLAIFFGLVLRWRSYRWEAGMVLSLLVVGAALFYFLSLRPRQETKSIAPGVHERHLQSAIWPAALRMWRDHPWLGAGPGHFDHCYGQYRPALAEAQNRPGRAHNDYLNTLADWGLAGALLVAGAWGALGWGVFRGWKYIRRSPSDLSQKRSNKSAFVLGAAIGFAGLLVVSLFDFNMHIPANAIAVVILMALVSGHLRFATDRYWVTLRRAGQILATVALGGAILYLGREGLRAARQQAWLARAARAEDLSPARLEALTQAFAAEPSNFETAYAVGEQLRRQSWRGQDGWQDQARAARGWFERSLALNPHDAHSALRLGMCEDWLGLRQQAEGSFRKALRLDPNSYFIRAHMGWHYFQAEQYEKALEWLRQSLAVNPTNNPVAETYLRMVQEKTGKTGPSSSPSSPP